MRTRPATLGRLLLAAAVLAAVDAATAACPPEPLPACRQAGFSRLTVRTDDAGQVRRLRWTWKLGTRTALAEFGDPLTSTTYSLCAWEPAGAAGELVLPPGGSCGTAPCWSLRGATTYRYRDSAATQAGIETVRLQASPQAKSKITVVARGSGLPADAPPFDTPFTVQLLRSDGAICFESIFPDTSFARNDPVAARATARLDATAPVPALPSAGCGQTPVVYPAGAATPDALLHDGLTRTFRVYVPLAYDFAEPMPVVLLFHGGFGSGAQIEANAKIIEVAEEKGFIAVSPDGLLSPAGIRTWNAGACCGYATAAGIDDVGFVRALIDRLESNACVDRRRVYATGMSNGAMLTHRLACDLADRIRAVAPVAGTDMTTSCAPPRPVPLMHLHGSADGNVPFDGGLGCGVAGVPFTSVPETIARAVERNGCGGAPFTNLVQGDGTCTRQGQCLLGADVDLCVVAGGGHVWPGGTPPALPGIGDCPFGYQSQSFIATRVLWDFFALHPPR
jgi:polyhydroxybutyrate depolymerase